MHCKLCLQERKLVKAHIIPRSFYKPMLAGEQPPELTSNAAKLHRSRVRIGLYDRTIVCIECEDRFKHWDDYAAKLLLSKATQPKFMIDEHGKSVGYTLENVDYTKLKLFFMSLLWRVSASSHYFFSQVKLGPHEAVLREMLLNADPGDENDFAVFVSRWDDPLGEHCLLYPHPQRYDDVNYIRCYLSWYIAEIKVDKRLPSQFHRPFTLKPNKPLPVVLRELRTSHEYEVLQLIARSQTSK